MTIKVFVFDSSDVVRAGLLSILDATEGIEVVGDEAVCDINSLRDPLTQILELRPHVLILDLGDAISNRLEVIKSLRLQCPETRLLIYTSRDCVASAQQLLAAGASGYLIKEVSGNEIVAAVRALAAGRKIVSISEFDNFIEKSSFRPDPTHPQPFNARPDPNLSDREHDVLSRIARGLTNQQAADELFLSVKTIETYRSRLNKKIGAKNRSDLFEYASSRGMLAESVDV